MGLNDLRDEFDEEIKQAAEELSNSLPLSKPQLRNAYSDDELREIHLLIKEVKEAVDENEKTAKLSSHALSVLKLLKGLGVGI